MKKITYLSFTLIALVFLSGCSHRYGRSVYAPHPIENMKVAVLPYNVITTGRITEMLSEEEIIEIETAESEAFQRSMYHQFIHRLEQTRYRSNVDVQYFGETNNRLADAEISFLEVNQLNSADLAELLGVDAVIRSEVHKHTYLTNLESYGLAIAHTLLVLFSDHYPWYLPGSETGDVQISSSIIRGSDGSTIWAASRGATTYWDRDTYDIIERINYKITKRIPL